MRAVAGGRTLAAMRAKVAAALTLGLAWPAPAAAEERVLAMQDRATPVHAYEGTAIFSRWDGTAFSLVASRDGAAPQPLAVPPRSEPFDADIGSDAQGRATVVLRRCDAGGCGLSLLRLNGSSPVPTGIRVTGDLPARPSLWQGAVAWVDRGRIRLRERSRSAGRVLERLPRDVSVADLELYGRHLAVSTIDMGVAAGVCGLRTLRLLDLRTRRARVLGTQLCGLNGQQWLGPSFDAGRVYFARTCNTECSARRFGAYRYDLRTRRFALAGDSRRVAGWAYGGRGTAYVVRATWLGCGPPTSGCSVVWTDELRFRVVRRPPHRTGPYG